MLATAVLSLTAAMQLTAQTGAPSPNYRVFVFNASPADWLYPWAYLPQSTAGINNAGQIVGFYTGEVNLECCGKFEPNYGYIRDFAGNLTQIIEPRASEPIQGQGTAVTGISSTGAIVGNVTTDYTTSHAFSKNSGSAPFINRDTPASTSLLGINNTGTIIGTSGGQAFYSTSASSVSNFTCGASLPAAQLVALNDSGIAVGRAGGHGFWVDLKQPATCHPLTILPASISNKGLVVGTVTDSFGTHNALGSISSSSYSNLDFSPSPIGASYTVTGINDNGEVTGTYYNPSSNSQGGYVGTELFVAAPVAEDANVTISSTAWSFSPHAVGTSSGPAHFYIANRGTAPALINNIRSSDYQFAVTSNTCQHVLPAGATCQVQVVFTPLLAGPQTTVLTIASNGATPTPSARLSGLGFFAR